MTTMNSCHHNRHHYHHDRTDRQHSELDVIMDLKNFLLCWGLLDSLLDLSYQTMDSAVCTIKNFDHILHFSEFVENYSRMKYFAFCKMKSSHYFLQCCRKIHYVTNSFIIVRHHSYVIHFSSYSSTCCTITQCL